MTEKKYMLIGIYSSKNNRSRLANNNNNKKKLLPHELVVLNTREKFTHHE